MVSKLIKANGCRGLEMGRVDAKNHPRLIHRTNWSNQILNCLLLQDPSSIWRRPDFRSMDLTDLPSTGLSKLWNQNKCFYARGDRWFTSLFLLMFIITCFLCEEEFWETFEWNIWNCCTSKNACFATIIFDFLFSFFEIGLHESRVGIFFFILIARLMNKKVWCWSKFFMHCYSAYIPSQVLRI